jgi:endonuclease-3
MLSAQSLDRNTAAATRNLFALARTPHAMLQLPDETIAQAIRPCGLYNMKTRNIRAFCVALLERHGGVVPDTRAGLMALPGIGRKCADIVLSFTFGHDVIAVDTHVHRVANRIGLTAANTADKTAHQTGGAGARLGARVTGTSGSSSTASASALPADRAARCAQWPTCAAGMRHRS